MLDQSAEHDASLSGVSAVRYIRGVPIDATKTYTQIVRVFPPKRGVLSSWWDKFQIEVGLNSFEPWEKITTLILFSIILTPASWFVWSVMLWLCGQLQDIALQTEVIRRLLVSVGGK